MTGKTLIRSIKSTFGRYIAILAIVALGVGFFAGLKNAEPSMQGTADQYYNRLNMYDFQLLSTLGIEEDDVSAIRELDGISAAEGVYKAEVILECYGKENLPYQVLSLPEQLAKLELTAGRLPENANECVADSENFTETDIGNTVTVVDGDGDLLKESSYMIVGVAKTPRYISGDRGSTALGNGTFSGFVYLPKDAFDSEVYHEMVVRIEPTDSYFSDEYEERINEVKPTLEDCLSERAGNRYMKLYNDTKAELDTARKELDDGWAQYDGAIAMGTPAEMLKELHTELTDGEAEYADGMAELEKLTEPETFVLDLNANIGYVNFANDTVIVSGIANAFPLFFVLVAALVCMTTMARMIGDERTQIGTLKSLGYSAGKAISAKYLLYSTSSSFLGCVSGFFIGTSVLPLIIWTIYGMRYRFAPLQYHFDTTMFIGCLAVSVIGALVVTLLSLQHELKERPASLIRPKAPTAGKRILLERITPLWKRLSFLAKVSLRNAFRYKKRMLMMLIGIAGCTALVITGFGLRDSVATLLDTQYEEILYYDALVTFDSEKISEEEINAILRENTEYIIGYQDSLEVKANSFTKEANVTVLDRDIAPNFFDLHNGETTIDYPSKGEAVISRKFADKTDCKIGSEIRLEIEGEEQTFMISGICDNYLGHYVYLSEDSFEQPPANSIFITNDNETQLIKLSTDLRSTEGVSYVSVSAEERATMEDTMSSMDAIVVVVIVCAGLLTFIVLFNLTNINIMERIKEIATVKVLGFHPNETAAYILRENILLSVIGALLGCPLGILLHRYVMAQVEVDEMSFALQILPSSFAISVCVVVFFAWLSCRIMRRKLNKVNMAESLKSVE